MHMPLDLEHLPMAHLREVNAGSGGEGRLLQRSSLQQNS
jgi:hypothetical protein